MPGSSSPSSRRAARATPSTSSTPLTTQIGSESVGRVERLPTCPQKVTDRYLLQTRAERSLPGPSSLQLQETQISPAKGTKEKQTECPWKGDGSSELLLLRHLRHGRRQQTTGQQTGASTAGPSDNLKGKNHLIILRTVRPFLISAQ